MATGLYQHIHSKEFFKALLGDSTLHGEWRATESSTEDLLMQNLTDSRIERCREGERERVIYLRNSMCFDR